MTYIKPSIIDYGSNRNTSITRKVRESKRMERTYRKNARIYIDEANSKGSK